MNKEINALNLPDEVIEALALARTLGLLNGHESVDSLADGGAQAIRSFSKEEIAKIYPDGLLFELSPEELDFMEATVAKVLANIDGYRAQLKEMTTEVGAAKDKVNNDSVSPERQLELARKYGISENLIDLALGDDKEASRKAVDEILRILANVLLDATFATEDFEDLMAMVGPRLSFSLS